MDKQTELLVITAEECGELTQAVMKHIRFGDNTESITKEAGDVGCMIALLVERGIIDEQELEHAMSHKRRKLMQWSSLFSAEPVPSSSDVPQEQQ